MAKKRKSKGKSAQLPLSPPNDVETGPELDWDEGPDDDEELPSDLQSVIILDASESGSVSPELALKAFRYDRDALLRGIRICQAEWLAWEDSATEPGDSAEQHEAEAWRDTEVLLTAALRLLVESYQVE